MVTELLNKYIWLVNTFVRAGEKGLSLEEICQRWESRFGTGYSRRTFNNHRMNVEDIFGIRVDCNRSTNRYFIDSRDGVSDEDAESAWLINTFTVNNMLSLGKERLHGRVAVEDIPSGHRFLTAIMDAMTECRELSVSYRKYTSQETDRYTVRPYAVKEAGRRWYLIGYCVERKGLRVYGLDRVMDIAETGGKFRMDKNFDVDELFSTSFGIYLPEGPGKTITFKAGTKDASYLRDLPIHKSQEEVSNDGTSVTFSIFVCPDKALIMEFCKYGSSIEVLSPESVRQAVADELRRASQLYVQGNATEH